MKYKLKVKSIWEFGQRVDSQGNKHQEDSFFPEYGKQSDTDRLFIVCDGMGGHDAGEVASATVCEAMSHSVLNDGHDSDGIFTEQDFKDALDAAFNALDGKDTGAAKKMGTTMTFLKLHNDGAFIAHIGDSRVYHIRPGKGPEDTQILFETYDHSLVNDLIKAGVITPEEALVSRQKNIITRAMQPNMDVRPKADIYTTDDIKAGDYFFLCTDGMIEDPDMAAGKLIKNIFSSLGGDIDNKSRIFLEATKENHDNHTAFIIYIEEVTDSTPSTHSEESDQAPEIAQATTDTDQAPETAGVTDQPADSDKSAIADEPSAPENTLEPQATINIPSDNNSTDKPTPVDSTAPVLPQGTDAAPAAGPATAPAAAQVAGPAAGPVPPQPAAPKTGSKFARYLLGGIILVIALMALFCIKTCSSNISKIKKHHAYTTQTQTDYVDGGIA